MPDQPRPAPPSTSLRRPALLRPLDLLQAARNCFAARANTVDASSTPPFPNLHLRTALRATGSALTAVRYLPIFTPRATLARWRSHRAVRSAAREARRADVRRKRRDWSQRFKLNGLTWHHLYISQDLRRIGAFLKEIQTRIDAADSPKAAGMAAAALVPLERSYAYLVDNVWDVYNALERDVLFPWVEEGIKDNPALSKALMFFSKERSRIEDEADMLQTRFARAVCSAGYSHTSLGPCVDPRKLNATRARRLKRQRDARDAKARAAALRGEESMSQSDQDSRRQKVNLSIREGYQPPAASTASASKLSTPKSLRGVNGDEVRQMSMDLRNLVEDTEELHKEERGLLFPLIANVFSEKEQGRLTNIIVYSMRASLAKFMIAVYQQSVEKAASRTQTKFYKREVPLPIRLYLPVWKKRFYDESPLGWLRSTPIKQAVK